MTDHTSKPTDTDITRNNKTTVGTRKLWSHIKHRSSLAIGTLTEFLKRNPIIDLLRALEPLGIMFVVIGVWFAVIQTQSAKEELKQAREQTRISQEAFAAERPVREMTLVSLAWEALERARNTRGVTGQYDALAALRKLRKADFSYANLSGIDFRRADLSRLQFSHSNLSGAMLDAADFKDANLTAATVTNDASLVESDFRGATLTSTTFSHVNLAGTIFEGNKLIQTKFYATALGETNFQNSYLEEVAFQSAELFETDFSNATLKRTSFTVRKMTGVKFHSAKIVASKLTSYRQPNLKTFAKKSDMKSLCLGESNEALRFQLYNAEFRNAELTCHGNAALSGSSACTSFHFANLNDVDFTNATFSGTDVSGTDFRETNLTPTQVGGMCWFADWCPPILPGHLQPPPLCEAE